MAGSDSGTGRRPAGPVMPMTGGPSPTMLPDDIIGLGAVVVAVLVVPVERDPGGLLACGACGYPPAFAAKLFEDSAWSLRWYVGRPQDLASFAAVALPLWWDSALVPEGWDRARRTEGIGLEPLDEAWFALQDPDPELRRVDAFAVELVRAGLASRVVRLAKVDGRLVEVTS